MVDDCPDMLFIITDIEMPECDGYALIKKITEAGFDLRLSKPVQAERLISSIRRLVDRDHLH